MKVKVNNWRHPYATAVFDNIRNIFDFRNLREFRHPVVKRCVYGDYNVKYDDAGITEILVPIAGAGAELEASSHELAHIVDLIFRKQLNRLKLKNYGLDFARALHGNSLLNAVKLECRVVAIQTHLLEMTAEQFPLSRKNFINDVINGFYSLSAFIYFSQEHPSYTDKKLYNIVYSNYRNISKESIIQALKDWFNFINENCSSEHKIEFLD